MTKSFNLMIVGFILLVIGVVLPLLMVTGVLDSTYFTNGVAVAGQVAGLFLGMIGIGMHAASRK